MRADDRIGYGLKDGVLVFVANVSRGLACGCVCPSCGSPLVAKKGTVRRHHFSHAFTTDCSGAAETVLHRLSKELLSEMESISIPEYSFFRQRKTKAGTLVEHRASIARGGTVRIDSVYVEQHQVGFIPDIIVKSGPKSLILEIAVTHKVERAKLRMIRHKNVAAIEIRLAPADALLSREALKSKLKTDLRSKMWLFHPAQREAERSYLLKLRAAISDSRDIVRSRVKLGHAKPRPYTATPGNPLSRLSEYDRTVNEFLRRHGRCPTLEECLQLWPHLWKP